MEILQARESILPDSFNFTGRILTLAKDILQKLGFTPCKANQPLWRMKLQKKKKHKKN